MKKLFDNPLSNKPHEVGEGVHRVYRFENGYGASVVRFRSGFGRMMRNGYGSYTLDESQWELAVVKFNGKGGDDFDLVYNTPITDDVIGYLDENGVEENLQKIKALK